MSTEMMYDPPSGWRYGFPRVYEPSNPLEPIEHTLRRDGYPASLLEHGMAKHCRFWEADVPRKVMPPVNDTFESHCWDSVARRYVERGVEAAEALETFGERPEVCISEKVGYVRPANDNLRHVAEATGRIQDDPDYQEFERLANEQGVDHAAGKVWPWQIERRKGDWMQLYSGKQFWPMDPRADEIEIEDIAHSLSMQCRYAGHCIRFYSVAEHSVLLARFFMDTGALELALWALLHDASEAYLVDVPRPVKPFLPGYKEAEARVMAAVCERFGLPPKMPGVVHKADGEIIGNERANMKPCVAEWYATGGPLPGVELFYWAPEKAEAAFLSCFREIERARQQLRRAA